MKKHSNIRAKKGLGQHFLNDPIAALKIVNSLTLDSRYKNILEIGPGTGVLTKHLADMPNHPFKCIDLDKESIDFLNQEYPALKDNIIYGDVLKKDVTDFFDEPFAIIGNFPYNISSQILFKILENKEVIPEMVGMFQLEVAERVCSKEGSRVYGILSVLLQAYYDIEMLFEVPPKSFNPPPKVTSAVIRMIRNDEREIKTDLPFLKQVVKAGFNQRRKKLRNALSAFLVGRNEATIPYLDLRAEALSYQQFDELAYRLSLKKI
ncbi:MAG: ribosomal RNA small subunit methyltransferase A [Bacteroidia bacterium]|nr:ribosomal RNA small subunit methyltransferase A [Bacteroidia bacterium]